MAGDRPHPLPTLPPPAERTVVPTATPTPTPTRRLDLAVGGMTCAACSARVERRLNRVGVRASVNLVTGRASILASADTDPEELISAVERAGYTAKLVVTGAPPDADDDTVRDLRRRLAVAAVLAMPLADLSLVLTLVPELRFPGWQWVFLALAAPMVGWCAWPFHRRAWNGLRRGTASMDSLVSLGTLAASAWSLWVLARGGEVQPGFGTGWAALTRTEGALYLDVAAVVITFLLAGRYIEARARVAAGSAVRALLRWGAEDVEMLVDGHALRVPVERLGVGDRFRVRPGEKIAADALVVDGTSAVDASLVTGESLPREVGPGDAVIGGTVNVVGTLTVTATRVGADSRLARMAQLVTQAQTTKARAQRLADRISAVFVPAVLVLAVATVAGWVLAGAPVAAAVTAALAVLVVACPCALGLATPTAMLAGTGRGAQLGIVLKGHDALEATRRIDTVLFDKTGTLTTGRMEVAAVRCGDEESRGEVLARAAAVERASEHPLAAAVVRASDPADVRPVTGFAALAGRGARGEVDGRTVLVGSIRMLAEHGCATPPELAAEQERMADTGATVVAVGWDGRVRAVCAVTDRVRPDARHAVTALRRLGVEPHLLTGDEARAAGSVAAAVGIDGAHVVAGALPEDKVDVVRRLQRAGRSVAVVGDGIHDAAAQAAADLGIAVGRGTDVAIEAADIVLGRDDLRAVGDAIELARRTHRTIVRNLVWAFGYNTAALPLAVAGLLSPLVAGLAMALSSVFVVTQSLRLRRFAPTPATEAHP